MRSLLVVRHGVLWLEEYFNGQKPEGTQPLYSCTKSVFSTVYGIAQDQGLLTLGQKISDFYPGWNPAFKDGSSAKDPITVGMLLSMTSGLDCNDIGVGSDNCGSAMGQTSDWVSFALALPLAHPPGKVWTYNGCCLTLLSQVIAQKSGMSFPDFANQRLLQPLGIADKDWVTGPKGENRVDYGLYWKARDWAKLGQLYLNKGLWEGKRIVSEAWVKDATTVHAPEGEAFGHDYGYLWHLKTLHWKGKPVRVFYANGYKGQEIYVSPDADLVCVLTADSDSTLIYAAGDRFFEDAILGSFK
jgi:CubicO group peptidase (beta-lactamase class C family)